MSFTLKLEAGLGTDFVSALHEARTLADKLGVSIEFKFNDLTIFIYAHMTDADLERIEEKHFGKALKILRKDTSEKHEMTERILSEIEVNVKCHMGQGAECCRFLVMTGPQFSCGYLNENIRPYIEVRASSMNAKFGPCPDPHDSTSEATL